MGTQVFMGCTGKVSCLTENHPSKDLRLVMCPSTHRSDAQLSGQHPLHKSLLKKGLVAVYMVSKAIVQEGSDPWDLHPEEAWSKSKLQLSCSCGSRFLCDTNRSIILSVAFVAFLYYWASQSVFSTQLFLLQFKRRLCGLFQIYVCVTDFKINSNLNTRIAGLSTWKYRYFSKMMCSCIWLCSKAVVEIRRLWI